MRSLEASLRASRDAGRKLLVPYITGGVDGWEEAGPWCEAADAAGVETVMLAAPTAPDERLPRICARSRGFVYAIGLLGVTGERDRLADSAVQMARRLKAVTDLPVLVGVGVSN